MISIVDANDLQYVLRPTVYRPFGRPLVISADRSEGSRRQFGEAVADRGASAPEVDQIPERSKR